MESALDLSLEAYEAYQRNLIPEDGGGIGDLRSRGRRGDEIHQRLLVDSEADDTARAMVDATSIMAYKSQSAKTIKECRRVSSRSEPAEP